MYHELIYDEKEKAKVELRATDFTRNEEILNNHAEWLDYNVSKVAGDKCRSKQLLLQRKMKTERSKKA